MYWNSTIIWDWPIIRRRKQTRHWRYLKGVNQVTDKSNKDIVSDFYAIMGDLYHIKKMNVEAYAAYDSALVYKETI